MLRLLSVKASVELPPSPCSPRRLATLPHPLVGPSSHDLPGYQTKESDVLVPWGFLICFLFFLTLFIAFVFLLSFFCVSSFLSFFSPFVLVLSFLYSLFLFIFLNFTHFPFCIYVIYFVFVVSFLLSFIPSLLFCYWVMNSSFLTKKIFPFFL